VPPSGGLPDTTRSAGGVFIGMNDGYIAKLIARRRILMKTFFSSIKLNSTKTSYQAFIEQQIKLIVSGETAVFCGAGISLNSGLPLANDIVREILINLRLSDSEIKLIVNSNLPFEAFMETLMQGCNIKPLLDIFNCRQPNTNHILLAKLVKHKYLKVICTTNFDQLLEISLTNEGLIKGKDYDVLYRDDDFSTIEMHNNKTLIIKLHGSIDDTDSIAITLQQVARKSLALNRGRILNNLFSVGRHTNVMIIGYSCSGVFDISPHIESITTDHKYVTLFDHHPTPHNNGRKEGEIENITVKDDKNPFKHFMRGKRLFVNTDNIVKDIWERCLDDKYSFAKLNYNHLSWKQHIAECILNVNNSYDKWVAYFIIGQMFHKISEFNKSIEYHDKALRIAAEVGNKKAEGMLLGHLGHDYDSLGEYRKAKYCYERSLAIAVNTQHKQGIEMLYGNLGMVCNNLSMYKEALEYYGQAIRIAEEIDKKNDVAIHRSNLAIVYNKTCEYQEAIENLEIAINLAGEISDIKLEGICLGTLGSSYYGLKRYPDAIRYYEKALHIAEITGDRKRIGVWSGNIGITYNDMGEYDKAIQCFSKAIEMAQYTGDRNGEANSYGNLGITYSRMAKYKEAIELFEKGLKIAEAIGNQYSVASWHGNLGSTYFNCGKYGDALEHYQKALTIYKAVFKNGDHPYIKATEQNIRLTQMLT
jgi:tetratricopeptide (TPR) repeat protein